MTSKNWCEDNFDLQEVQTDEEILEDLKEPNNKSDETETEKPEDDERVPTIQSNTVKSEDALYAIETSIKWAEENSASLSTLTCMRKVREAILKKMFRSKIQKTIENYFTLE